MLAKAIRLVYKQSKGQDAADTAEPKEERGSTLIRPFRVCPLQRVLRRLRLFKTVK